MSKFNIEETNLMCIYSTGTRSGLLLALAEMKTYLEQDEIELLQLTNSVISKLTNMSNQEYESIMEEVIANFNRQEAKYDK